MSKPRCACTERDILTYLMSLCNSLATIIWTTSRIARHCAQEHTIHAGGDYSIDHEDIDYEGIDHGMGFFTRQ